jgi:hypothetical protein
MIMVTVITRGLNAVAGASCALLHVGDTLGASISSDTGSGQQAGSAGVDNASATVTTTLNWEDSCGTHAFLGMVVGAEQTSTSPWLLPRCTFLVRKPSSTRSERVGALPRINDKRLLAKIH